MKPEDKYLKIVRWSDKDSAYVGFCAGLFPWGGVCHGENEEQVRHELSELVCQEIAELQSSGNVVEGNSSNEN
jgi:hypothetical protein